MIKLDFFYLILLMLTVVNCMKYLIREINDSRACSIDRAYSFHGIRILIYGYTFLNSNLFN